MQDPFSIPIIINNFNRVTTTDAMVRLLLAFGYPNIHILDNDSTYPPLLKWYVEMEDKISIHRMGQNFMQNAIFDYKHGAFLQEFQGKVEWIAYTDSDLTLNPGMPYYFIHEFIKLAERWNHKKVGCALKVDDLPPTPWGDKTREWEARFWLTEIEPNVFDSQIDTTFSIWNPCNGLMYSALRVAGDYIARHEPWYTDFSNLSEEEKYYLDHSHSYSTYKRFYDNINQKQ